MHFRECRIDVARVNTILLGPALGTSTAIWDLVVDQLAGDVTVLTWELPGHAGAAPAPRAFELTEIADGIAQSLTAMGFGPVVASGVSVGGAVSLEIGLRHPALVSDVVMVCSAVKFGTPELWTQRAAAARATGTAQFRESAARMWASEAAIATPRARRLLDDLEYVDDESYALLAEAIGRYDARGRLSRLQPRLSHVRGSDDVLVPEAAAEVIRAVAPDTVFTVLDGARHIAPLDRPVELAGLISALLPGR